MRSVIAFALFAAASAEVAYKETFGEGWEDRWVMSTARTDAGKFTVSPGEWFGEGREAEDSGLFTSEAMRFYATGSKMAAPTTTKGKDLVLQFSVKHEKREYSFCGGGYIKLLAADADLDKFDGDTPYSVMFGPDMCGYDVSRIHLIFNFDGENLLKTEDIKLDYSDKNEFTHLYTLVLKADKTYTVYFDQKEKATGKLIDTHAFPQPEIDDPEDSKPEEWVDEKKIPDPEDVKPAGWDDIPEEIPDPDAAKPEDWDDEDDGEWEAPMIDNPEYKGEFVQKMIENPDYVGEWSPKQIANEKYTDDIANYDVGAVGFELWVVNEGSVFDNIFVGDDYEEAKAFADSTWVITAETEKAAKEAIDATKKEAEEAAKAEEEAAKAEEAGEEADDEAEEEEEETHDEL